MTQSRSFVSRVAWGSILAACTAALITAVAASVFAAYLTQNAEDRRLRDAALVLATELEATDGSTAQLNRIVQHELEETQHMGLLFAVYQPTGQLAAGEKHLPRVPRGTCTTTSQARLRLCGVSNQSLEVVVAAAHADLDSLFVVAAVLAALLAAGVAWAISQPLAKRMVGPLSRLRERLSQLDIEKNQFVEFGPPEQVVEVDELREAIATLFLRAAAALSQSARFAADAAHELRTPLAAIQAELELLHEDISKRHQDDLRRVQRLVARLETLVERLLVLATPHQASTRPNECISLRDVVEDAVTAIKPEERERISFELEVDVLVQGDPTLLGVLFSNALSNALKFGRVVIVSLSAHDESAILRVIDDGPGIPPNDWERVFEPFYRAPSTRRLSGHGLGLAIIAHIAKSHGGSVHIVDRVSGTCLEIRIPRILRA